MADLQTTLAPLSRDELLILSGDLAVRQAIRTDDLDRMVLSARWQAASAAVLTAQQTADESFAEWAALACRGGKLTSKVLAEREKAKRRADRLGAIAKRAEQRERDLWGRLSATWTPAVDNEQALESRP